ncbi:hypothetical protein ABZ832_12515 [Streptantibioticus parmotrematis]|uniref:hypothetical protein n=1 Tax=Streptantibioticus parmotrematis TaxID=2873249 RepID=UPI0033EBAEA9
MKHIHNFQLIDTAAQISASIALGFACTAPSAWSLVAACATAALAYNHRSASDVHMLRTMADLNTHAPSTADEIQDRLGTSTHSAASALSRLLHYGMVTRTSYNDTDLFHLT